MSTFSAFHVPLQGSIFRWSRDQRCHLKNKGESCGRGIQIALGFELLWLTSSSHQRAGTDADPFDPQRGLIYRYIGWFLMHKTPKMIEACQGRPSCSQSRRDASARPPDLWMLVTCSWTRPCVTASERFFSLEFPFLLWLYRSSCFRPTWTRGGISPFAMQSRHSSRDGTVSVCYLCCHDVICLSPECFCAAADSQILTVRSTVLALSAELDMHHVHCRLPPCHASSLSREGFAPLGRRALPGLGHCWLHKAYKLQLNNLCLLGSSWFLPPAIAVGMRRDAGGFEAMSCDFWQVSLRSAPEPHSPPLPESLVPTKGTDLSRRVLGRGGGPHCGCKFSVVTQHLRASQNGLQLSALQDLAAKDLTAKKSFTRQAESKQAHARGLATRHARSLSKRAARARSTNQPCCARSGPKGTSWQAVAFATKTPQGLGTPIGVHRRAQALQQRSPEASIADVGLAMEQDRDDFAKLRLPSLLHARRLRNRLYHRCSSGSQDLQKMEVASL